MRVVVVGATGNLGTALLTRLQSEADVTELVGVARRAPRTASPPYGDVQWFTLDVGDAASPDRLARAFVGVLSGLLAAGARVGDSERASAGGENEKGEGGDGEELLCHTHHCMERMSHLGRANVAI